MKYPFNRLTFEQKIKLVMGADFWTNYDIEGKLYKFTVSDGPVGLRKPQNRETADQIGSTIPSIAYPSTQMLSHTWNKELARKMGEALGNDCIDLGVDILLAPGVNIKRLPLNGRNFEYVSEDPFLAGTLAKEYILGVQSKHVGTSLKHFCCNNSEYSRKWASMEVEERTLREIYLKPFQIACEAKPWTVMCSYNLVNGVRMSENTSLYNILRNEFGFDGLIMSDWEAVKNTIHSVNAGINWEMPFDEAHQRILLDPANRDSINMEALDASAKRVIELAERCEETSKIRKIDMSKDERRSVALQVAEEGIVLLKNKENALPLQEGTVLVTGAPSFHYYSGDGSSKVVPEGKFLSVLDALKNNGVNATWQESIWEVNCNQAHVGDVPTALRKAKEVDCVLLCVGDQDNSHREAFDRQTIKLTLEEELVILDLAKASKKIILAVYGGSCIDMSSFADEVDAIVYVGFPGQEGNQALANVLTGKVNPSGKLTETFPLHLEDVPSISAYRDSISMRYEEGLDVGYRYFDTHEKPVLFPFGYGLSYSKFEYSDLTVNVDKDQVEVSFEIENTSDFEGKEIAQIYVGETSPKVYRPKKELKGYEKVSLKPHEKKKVRLSLGIDAFQYWESSKHKWTVSHGEFIIYIGKSVSDIALIQTINY